MSIRGRQCNNHNAKICINFELNQKIILAAKQKHLTQNICKYTNHKLTIYIQNRKYCSNVTSSVYLVRKQTHISLEWVTLIVRIMGPTWGPPGADRTHVGPMWATWTLLSGNIWLVWCTLVFWQLRTCGSEASITSGNKWLHATDTMKGIYLSLPLIAALGAQILHCILIRVVCCIIWIYHCNTSYP